MEDITRFLLSLKGGRIPEVESSRTSTPVSIIIQGEGGYDEMFEEDLECNSIAALALDEDVEVVKFSEEWFDNFYSSMTPEDMDRCDSPLDSYEAGLLPAEHKFISSTTDLPEQTQIWKHLPTLSMEALLKCADVSFLQPIFTNHVHEVSLPYVESVSLGGVVEKNTLNPFDVVTLCK